MKFRIVDAVIFVFIFFAACEKEELLTASDESENLTGYWANQQLADTLYIYERSGRLVDNDYGFAFLSGGKFIERKNAGWCGTPPISYADFEGSWSLNDSIITVTVGYWGGTSTYHWRVVSANDNLLIIDVISEEYSQEN
jgi:hypothetical protein